MNVLPVTIIFLLCYPETRSESSNELFCTNNRDSKWDGIDEVDEVIDTTIRSQVSDSFSPSNIYDTYNADECRRVRRPWNGLTSAERQLYVDALLELRKNGECNIGLDELVAVASPHDSQFGAVTHHDSDYLFWHGYLVWELESRIRNLGGKYKCFGMPYWDFTSELSSLSEDDIFQTGLGGYGDPNNYWNVNGYSWDVSTKQYWSPPKDLAEDCSAVGDECPVCSLKRKECVKDTTLTNAQQNGAVIIDPSSQRFPSFQRWVYKKGGLPHCVDHPYDPIWYLFHAMESYYQAMWINCNDYDLIDAVDLDKYPMAFTGYCDWPDEVSECVAIGLDDTLYFGGVLAKRPWSFIHNEVLTIRKLYHLPQWNVIYDLNGDSFFIESGLEQNCKQKLNSEWFILPVDESKLEEIKTEPEPSERDETQQNLEKEMELEQMDRSVFMSEGFALDRAVVMVVFVVFVIIIFGLAILWILKNNKAKTSNSEYVDYGSISFSKDAVCFD